jgi:hypothetical protein
MYGVYKQKQSAYGKYAVTNPQIESAFSQVQKQVPALSNLVKKEQAKGTGKWWGNTDPSKVNLLNQDIQQIQSIGGLPSMQGSNQAGSQNQQIQQGNASLKSPAEVKAAFQAGEINQDQAVELLQSF